MVQRKKNNSETSPPSTQERRFATFNSLGEAYRKLSPYLNIGYVMAASIALLTWLGYVLDKKWDTYPWLTITGALLGIVTGFYNFFKTVFAMQNKDGNSNHHET